MRIEDMLTDEQLDMIFKLSIMANVFQIGSFMMDSQQVSNDSIMKELQNQDLKYLERILENQILIMKEINYIKERLDNEKTN